MSHARMRNILDQINTLAPTEREDLIRRAAAGGLIDPLRPIGPIGPIRPFPPLRPGPFFPTLPGVPTAPTPTPTPEPEPGVDLQFALAAIPRAEDGHVITSEYHNALRLAVLTIAARLGAGPDTGALSLPFAPTFVQNADGPNWVLTKGVATKPPGGTKANGWLPLDLPDRGSIAGLTVTGTKSGAIASFLVVLVRVAVADGSSIDLITLQLKGEADQFSKTGTVNVSGAGAAANEQFKRVEADDFFYGVAASVLATDGVNSAAQITSLRVDCTC